MSSAAGASPAPPTCPFRPCDIVSPVPVPVPFPLRTHYFPYTCALPFSTSLSRVLFLSPFHASSVLFPFARPFVVPFPKPHRTIPHHTIPTPYHTMPCHTMPCHATPHPTMPRHTMPHHAMPHHTMPCHTLPFHTTPHHTILESFLLLAFRCRASYLLFPLFACEQAMV
jgi:hypothetical protein